MAGRKDRSEGGTLGRGTDTIQQHLSSWDRAVENICEEFADFGYMDDEEDDEVGDGIWREMASNNSGLHTLTPNPPRYSLRDTTYNYDANSNDNSNSNTLTNHNVNRRTPSSNPFSVNSVVNDNFDVSGRPVPAPRSSTRQSTQSNGLQNNGQNDPRDNSQIPLIDFSDDDVSLTQPTSSAKSNQGQNFGRNVGPTLSQNTSNPGASIVTSSPGKIKEDLSNSSVSNQSQPNQITRFDLIGTTSASSLSSDLNSSAGSLAFSDVALDDQNQQYTPEQYSRPPVRTVQSFDSNLDNLSAVERTMEKLSSWPVNEAFRLNNSGHNSASQDSINTSEDLGAVGAVGGVVSQQTQFQNNPNEKSGDQNLTIQAEGDNKTDGQAPSEPPPSYEEAMRGMPILHSSPQSNQQQQQQQQNNRLSWQPPAQGMPQGYNGENRLSWQQGGQQPPAYQQPNHPLQRPLSYHSSASLGSVDSGRLLCYPPEDDAPGYVHHKDFHPEFIDGPEKFDMLVAKANSWLMDHPNARVLHCESPLHFSAYSLGFSANRVISTKSKQYNEPTMAVRFLRIWIRMIDFSPEGDQGLPPHQISYRNFTNPIDGSTVLSLAKTANRTIQNGLQGQVLCMETLYTLAACLQQPDICCWVERYQDKKPYAFFMRMFLLDDPEQVEGQIEMMDFIPVPTTRSMPHDFEPFASLIDSMRNWLHTRQNTHVLNIQSFYVKWKPIRLDFWQRVHFSEGGMNSILPHPTHYLNMLRVYYTSQPTLSTVRCGPSYQIICKTFAPVQLTSPSDAELKFESIEQTIDRVKHWLKLADAEIVSMETVSVMMYLRNHGIFGPEVTHTWTEMPNATSQTYLLHCVRVYIAGDFNPPSINELPSVPQVTPYYTTGPPRTISVQRATVTFPPPPSPVKRR